MQMSISKKIGKNKYTFLAEGKNLYEMITESQKLSFPDVEKCGLCGSDDLILTAHEAQSFKYSEIRCNECRGQVNFGQRKDNPDTSFLRRTDSGAIDWKPFKKEEEK